MQERMQLIVKERRMCKVVIPYDPAEEIMVYTKSGASPTEILECWIDGYEANREQLQLAKADLLTLQQEQREQAMQKAKLLKEGGESMITGTDRATNLMKKVVVRREKLNAEIRRIIEMWSRFSTHELAEGGKPE